MLYRVKETKKTQLIKLARVIDSHSDWWRFPTEDIVQGFLGTDSLFIVGDQPSQSTWGYDNPNRRTFYEHLIKFNVANAHLTDVYKRRGRSSSLAKLIPADFQEHVQFFRKEIEILRPTRIIALGDLAYRLLAQYVPETKPILKHTWHFSYVASYGKNRIEEYEEKMRQALSAK